ncbi:MAG: hypothetical protein U7123_22185 [Potamolinea sp.]
MKAVIALIVSVVIFYFSALKWRRSVKVVFLLLVLEGALRKWVLPQANEMIYFLKDIVVLGAYFNFYLFSDSDKRFIKKLNFINILIFLVLGWCLFQVFNPSLGSPLIGIFGLRAYILYLPLIWMLPSLFQSEGELYKFLRSHLLLLIPVGLIGIVQFFSPATSFINRYSNEEGPAVATFGANSATRITGTFSYINNYALYLIVCFGLLVFMLSIKQSWLWQLASFVEIFFVSINSFMTGSRGTIFAEILFLVSFLSIKILTNPASIVRLTKQLIIPVLIVAIAASTWFLPAINAFLQRTTANHDVSWRIVSSFTEPFDFMQYKQLDGYGTGATHQATPALRKALDLPKGEVIPVYFEPEMGRIALELGPIGFFLWYGLRLSIIIALLFNFWKLKTLFLRQLALTALLIQVIQFNGQLVFHHTFCVYYWFLSSLIFLLPRLEEIENWHREQQLLEEEEDVLYPYFPDSSYR